MQNNPLVSVYIPTHNRAELLPRAIESVLAQTYPSIEIIVCSDGSTDSTDEVMAGYCQKHNNIRYIKHESPKGACAARNACIELAQGEFCTGLDDDDVFTPHRIEVLVEQFDPGYAFVCANQVELDLSSKELPQESFAVSSVSAISLTKLLSRNTVGNQVLTYTERFKAIDGFDVQMPAWQDYDTWVRLSSKFGAGKKINAVLYFADIDHRRVRISASSNRFKGCAKFYEKHWEILSNAQRKNSHIRKALIGGEYPSFIRMLSLFSVSHIRFWLKAMLVKCGLASA